MRGVAAAGALLMMASPLLAWIHAPISGSQGAGFGWIAMPLGAIAGLGLLRRSRRPAVLCAAGGLSLCAVFVLHLTILDPAFWRLLDENAQYGGMMDFSFAYLPGNMGIESSFEPDLATETVLDRFRAAIYFMGRGWWLGVAGSLALLAGGWGLGGLRGRRMAMAVVLILASPGVVLVAGVVGQHMQERAERSMAAGRYAEAIEHYGRAQRFDPQLVRSVQVLLRVGEAHYHLGRQSHPSALFYLATVHFQQGNVDAAIAQYRLATAQAPRVLREVIDRRIAWTFAQEGVAQYGKRLIGPAAGGWERSLTADPDHLQAAYFLSRAYFDLGRYEESVHLSRFLLGRSRNKLLNAQIHANIGDAHWKRGDSKSARTAYEESLRLDKDANYRVLKSLGGT